jgi:hypothetical protein
MEAAQSDLAQPAIPWPRDSWLTAFPDQQDFLQALPDELARSDVRDVCSGAAPTPDGAVSAFLATMAWGHGDTGYGIYRTRRILKEAAGSGPAKLARARQVVLDAGPLGGYEALANQERLRYLGPSFGTKFLFFQREDALILDDKIGRWFKSVDGRSLRWKEWLPQKYTEYLEQMDAWSGQAGVSPARFEETVFTLIAEGSGGQWDARRA